MSKIKNAIQGHKEQRRQDTLLVFNCHEPWVYQLGVLGFKLDIIIGLKGRYIQTWDEQMRPMPVHCRLINLQEVLQSPINYYCIITHNITDLLDIKTRTEPRLIVLHSTIEGRLLEEQSNVNPEKMKETLHNYLDLTGGHTVATSMFKGESWGFTEDIVTFGIEANYPPYTGESASGLRICNFIDSRKKILLWDFYEKAFEGIPVKIVGHNPGMPGVTASKSWSDLKKILQSHRFYIHTAEPRLEAGYNMASIEAMASGLPVLGNRHPTSPIKHGLSGFLSDNPNELRKYARMLLEDRKLAELMGREAQKTAKKHFSISKFRKSFLKSIETARQKWEKRKINL